MRVPELGTFVFIIPGWYVKNSDDQLVVLNRIAQSVVEAQRGQHATHYSAAELSKLLEAANRVCEADRRQPELVVLRRLSVA